MGELGSSMPKSLIEIAGKTILEHLLVSLRAGGVTDVLVVVGWLGDQVQEAVTSLPARAIESSEWQHGPLFTMLSGFNQVKWDSFLVCPGDLLTDSGNVAGLLASHTSHITLAVDTSKRVSNPFYLDDDDRVLCVSRPPESFNQQAASAQMLFCNTAFVNYAKQCANQGMTTLVEVIDSFLEAGHEVDSYKTPLGSWLDIDDIPSVIKANRWVLERMPVDTAGMLFVPASDKIEFNHTMTLSSGIRIGAGTSIHGPVYIGPYCDIGPVCRMGPYVSLGAQSRIGGHSILDDVVTFNQAELQRNVQLKGAIIVGQEVFMEES